MSSISVDVLLLPSSLAGEYLDFLVQEALGKGQGQEGAEGSQQGGAAGIVAQVQRTMNSLSYFMRSLTK
jgi:ABC-type phosphate transport system substrate-binding protein